MAYFSSGTEGTALTNECVGCPLFDKGCPIACVQLVYNYDACNNPVATKILNDLVEQGDEGEYIGCQMKPLIKELLM